MIKSSAVNRQLSLAQGLPLCATLQLYDPFPSQTYRTMATRPLNDDEVLSEMNKMVRSSNPYTDNVTQRWIGRV